MSPHEWSKLRGEFDEAAAKFGWRRAERTDQHERDWDCSRKVYYWVDSESKWLFDEGGVEENFVRELIRVSRLVRADPMTVKHLRDLMVGMAENLGVLKTHG